MPKTTMMQDVLINAGIKIPKGATGFYTSDKDIVFIMGEGEIKIRHLNTHKFRYLHNKKLTGSRGWSLI